MQFLVNCKGQAVNILGFTDQVIELLNSVIGKEAKPASKHPVCGCALKIFAPNTQVTRMWPVGHRLLMAALVDCLERSPHLSHSFSFDGEGLLDDSWFLFIYNLPGTIFVLISFNSSTLSPTQSALLTMFSVCCPFLFLVQEFILPDFSVITKCLLECV
jgi:hypothetical protein